MATYTIEPEHATLHGQFSREFAPVLTIDPGDTVCYRTLDAGWNLEPRRSTIASEHPPRFQPRIEGLDQGHAMCGPIAIRGAEPGMTLVVEIKDVRPGTWGWTAVGGWPTRLHERLGMVEQGTFLLWTLDADQMIGRNQHGHTISLRPFMGVLGMPPDEPGWHSTSPPRVTGGNIDCKELVAGSTLYLPIAVPGGLFSVGDGHGAQGDGEVSCTAIECPMERVELRFDLDPDLRLTTPRANTPAGWITFGFHTDLYEAMLIALEAMLDLMQTQFQLSRHEAFGLASVLVDLRITQIVNAGVLGVHAVLPHGALR
jgi:acetamidase/formamidase